MSSNPQSVPATDELSSNRALIANAAGWFGLIMLIGYLLYWGVTGNNFDLPAKVLLIVGLLAIGTFGLMQGKIADMYTALQSSRGFAYMVAQQLDAGHKSRIDPAACLLNASQNAVKVALEAIQSLGGNGYINEYPAGRLLRDAKLYEIGAGTNEIRRMLIGRELFHGKS